MRQRLRKVGGRRRLGWMGGLALSTTVLLLAFQNCSQPPVGDESGRLASEASQIDFAYDVKIDQVAYMSCAPSPSSGGATLDASAYFTFRVGAYRDLGGVRLLDSFRTQMGRKSAERQALLLGESPANAFTDIQFALRAKQNYQNILTTTGSPVAGQDFVNPLPSLGTPEMNQLLVEQDPALRLRYIRNGTPNGWRMEGDLFFTKGGALAESVRGFLRDQGLLALTFTNISGKAIAATETLARSPADVIQGSTADPTRSVYGTGFRLEFGQPNPTNTTTGVSYSLHALFPSNVMTAVSEQNLLSAANRTGLGTWSCPVELQFRIVRYDDIILNTPNINCTAAPDPIVFSTTQEQTMLELARNSLRAEDWYIDLANRCIVPKKDGLSCYGQVTNINYAMNEACDASGTCVQHASICYRTK